MVKDRIMLRWIISVIIRIPPKGSIYTYNSLLWYHHHKSLARASYNVIQYSYKSLISGYFLQFLSQFSRFHSWESCKVNTFNIVAQWDQPLWWHLLYLFCWDVGYMSFECQFLIKMNSMLFKEVPGHFFFHDRQFIDFSLDILQLYGNYKMKKKRGGHGAHF